MHPQQLLDAFAACCDRPCDVLARAPGRVNLIGEHTDYNDGYVLPIAVRPSTWVAGARRGDALVRVASINLNDTCAWTIDSWRREACPHWTSYVAGVETLLRRRGARLGGFDLLIASDVPPGGGLSSSAALEVATGLALAALAGQPLEPTELADLCRQAEHEFAGVPCGIMDQYVSLLGRADAAILLDCRSRQYEHIPLRLGEHTVIVVDSGVRHELAASEYARRQDECRRAVAYFQRFDPTVRSLRDVALATVAAHARRMEPTLAARSRHVVSEIQRTLEAAESLRRADLPSFGRLMAASHQSLRDDYEVSCAELDRLVEIVRGVDGVVGARMTGGGFGGCIVAIAPRAALSRIKATLRTGYDVASARPARLIETEPGPGASIERT